MRVSEIKFNVELDEQNIPEKIFWKATDGASRGVEETKSISLSVWDHLAKESLRIDLWSKDMPVHELKRFYIDIIGGLANSLRIATGDEIMAREMEKLCDTLVRHLQKEAK
ncbi:MAG: gliding motility protein GldC [Flammeovirgaceae bacterium]|nr:gliding motility protein GldC [Flammeovirgaceae bacterium]